MSRRATLPSAGLSGGLLLSGAYAMRALAQLALLVGITRAAPPDVLRDFILGVAIITPAQPLAEMSLRQLYVLARVPPGLRSVMVVRTISSTCLLAIAVVVGALVSVSPAIMLPVAAAKVVDLVADGYHASLQRGQRMPAVALLIGANGLATAFTAAAVALLGGSGYVALWLSVAWSMGFLVAGALVERQVARDRFDRDRWSASPLVRQGLPVGLGVSIMAVATATPQYVLAAASSVEDLARFAYLMYLVVAFDLLTNGVTQGRLSELREARDAHGLSGLRSAALRQAGLLSVVNTCMAAVLLAAYVPLVRLTTGLRLDLAWTHLVMVLFLVAVMPFAFQLANALTAYGLGKTNLLISATGATGVVLGATLLVPRWWLGGALLAMCFGPAARALASVVALRTGVRRAT